MVKEDIKRGEEAMANDTTMNGKAHQHTLDK
jgi:hypothetical protein